MYSQLLIVGGLFPREFFDLIQIKDFITQYVTGGRDGRRGQLLIKTKNSL